MFCIVYTFCNFFIFNFQEFSLFFYTISLRKDFFCLLFQLMVFINYFFMLFDCYISLSFQFMLSVFCLGNVSINYNDPFQIIVVIKNWCECCMHPESLAFF